MESIKVVDASMFWLPQEVSAPPFPSDFYIVLLGYFLESPRELPNLSCIIQMFTTLIAMDVEL
jgi:hypothetical protein